MQAIETALFFAALFAGLRGGPARLRLPGLRALRSGDVEASEQHRELGAIEHDAVGTSDYAWHAKAATRESLVIDDKAAAIPEEHLHAIASSTDEDEEVAGERVKTERVLHERVEAVVTPPEIDGLRREEHLRAGSERQHASRTAATRAAT